MLQISHNKTGEQKVRESYKKQVDFGTNRCVSKESTVS